MNSLLSPFKSDAALAGLLTFGMALALTRRRPGAYSQGAGLANAGAFA